MKNLVNKIEDLKVKNLKPMIEAFAKTIPPVDRPSEALRNYISYIVDAAGSFFAIDEDGTVHHVEYVGNWGRLYLGHQFGKVDLDKVVLIYQY